MTPVQSSVPAGSVASTMPGVWERVWRQAPTAERDDALLTRERSGPRWDIITSNLERAFGRIDGLRTIELGSGRGDLSVLLAERGAVVTLLDTSATALELAQRRFDRLRLPVETVQADMFEWPGERRDQFDVALSSGVIEHFSGDARTGAIRAHYEAIRAGGLAVISAPHAMCPPYRIWKFYLELRRRWPYGLERPYGRREIARRAHDAGLVDVQTSAVGFWHSLSAHWARELLRMNVDWANRRSVWDRHLGLILLLFGRKPQEFESESCAGRYS